MSLEVTAPSLVGHTLGGRFLVRYPIASGGMGAVYEAEDLLLGRRVALKVVRSDLLPDPRTKERFRREALATAAVSHPALVTLFDLSLDTSPPFLVMELIEGMTIDELLSREGRVPWPRALRWTLDILDALDALHRVGVIHRDIKPNNLMIVGQGESERCRVIDLGVARLLAPMHAELTATGVAVGTPAFMAPEQLAGESVGPPADLWALGVVLFKALTGVHPFSADITQPGGSTAESLSTLCPGLPSVLVESLASLLQRNPAHRPQAARGLMNPLRALLRMPGLPSGLGAPDGLGLDSTPGASQPSVPVRVLPQPSVSREPSSRRLPLLLIGTSLLLGAALAAMFASGVLTPPAPSEPPPIASTQVPHIEPRDAAPTTLAVGVLPPPEAPLERRRRPQRPATRETRPATQETPLATTPETQLPTIARPHEAEPPLASSPGRRPASRVTVTLLGASSESDTEALGPRLQSALERCVSADQHYAGDSSLSMYVSLTPEGTPSAFHPTSPGGRASELACIEGVIRRTRWPAAPRARTTTIRILALR